MSKYLISFEILDHYDELVEAKDLKQAKKLAEKIVSEYFPDQIVEYQIQETDEEDA